MKRTLLALFFVSTVAMAQTKKDNTITIKTTQPAFDVCMRTLLQNQFPIKTESKEYGYITTDFTEIDTNLKVKINAVVKDSTTLVLSGDVGVQFSFSGELTIQRIQMQGTNNSPMRKGWLYLVEFANQIPGEKTYSKR